MDPYGKLLVAYAVELDNGGRKTVKTGDESNLLMYMAMMLTALLLLIFTIMSFRKDRRMSRAAAGAGQTGRSAKTGKERD